MENTEKKQKIAVIGDRESVLGFLALGFTVCEVQTDAEAEDALRKTASSGEYAIIFITEEFAPALSPVIEKYKDDPTPAVVTIPSADGKGNGYGMAALHRAVERAVGADILG